MCHRFAIYKFFQKDKTTYEQVVAEQAALFSEGRALKVEMWNPAMVNAPRRAEPTVAHPALRGWFQDEDRMYPLDGVMFSVELICYCVPLGVWNFTNHL